MLIDILRMPPVLGVPIDRRVSIVTSEQIPVGLSEPIVHWPALPVHHKLLSVGSLISKAPQNLYKKIHVSHDNKWVFETVYAVEDIECFCLYTKIISATNIGIGVSVNSIRKYRSMGPNIVPISQFIIPKNSSFSGKSDVVLGQNQSGLDNIVPPVFGQDGLWRHVSRLLDLRIFESLDHNPGLVYKPLYDHEPSILRHLIEGLTYKHPFNEIRCHHPLMDIQLDRWYKFESLAAQLAVTGCHTYINNPGFDELSLRMVSAFPSKFSVAATMAHAIDQIDGLWLTREYYDPYQSLLRSEWGNDDFHREVVRNILRDAAMMYCRLYSIDCDMFIRDYKANSSVTISKNIHDEVVFTFHDMIADRHVSFYTSFPALVLSTLSVGWY